MQTNLSVGIEKDISGTYTARNTIVNKEMAVAYNIEI